MNKDLTQALSKVPETWKSNSRIYGEACEYWLSDNVTCPECKLGKMTKLTANVPVVDHACTNCGATFQVKEKNGKILKRDGSASIIGADYKTTLISLQAEKGDWSMILISYCREANLVKKVSYIPSSNIKENNIVPRKPLGPNARRAGWQGCNIVFSRSDIHSML